jgi:biopolymer transport protein ExbD
MARRKRKQVLGSGGEPNMTPMIDCTFQLIIFFILTAQMANAELAKIIPPDPQRSVAEDKPGEVKNDRVIVNIANEYGDDPDRTDPRKASWARNYKVGGKDIMPGDMDSLVDALRDRKDSAVEMGIDKDEFFIEVRADKDIQYADVEPVMRAARDADIKKMYITAIVPVE